MRKNYLFFYLILIFIISSCTQSKISLKQPVIKNGILNLTNWNLEKNGNVMLIGTWEFYWNKLISPKEFENNNHKPSFVQVPGNWFKNNKNYNQYGYSTYRVKILLKNSGNNFTIRIPKVASSYKLYINKKIIYQNGKIGTSRKTTEPDDSPKEILFSSYSNEIELIFQIANYHDTNAGILLPIILGTSENIKNNITYSNMVKIILFGIIMFAVLFNLLLFIMRKKDKASLLFSIFCFIVAFRTILLKHYLFIEATPLFSYELIKSLGFLMIPLGLLSFTFYFHLLFKSKSSKIVLYIITFFSLLYSLIIILTPFRIYIKIMNYFHIIMILYFLYVPVWLIYLIIKRKQYAGIYFIGILFLFSIIIIEIIQYRTKIVGTNFSIFGLLAFIILNSAIQSIKFSKTFIVLEKQSILLEEKVNERTIQLEKANDSIKNMSEEKINFFVNLVHETKTPLTIIDNFLDKDIKTRGKSEDIKIVKNNIIKLKNNMINLLDLEKLDKKLIFYNHKTIINISEETDKIFNQFKDIAEKKKIKITKKIQKNIFLKIDNNAFDRIIFNLIDNSLKYTNENGHIIINLQNTKDKTILSVKDTGIGISKDQLENIFKPYHQISHKKRNIQGLGLGLNIVKKITSNLKAELIVKSTENKGSEFIIEFNKVEVKKSDIKKIKISDHPPNVQFEHDDIELKKEIYNNDKNTLFIVEDNKQMLYFLQSHFYEYYNIYYALNGKEGIEKINWIPKPDLIISDVMMDIMDGYEFCEKIFMDEKLKDIPFIFLSAKNKLDDKIAGLKEGAIDFITKPFSIEELESKIKSILLTIESKKARNKQSMIKKFSKILEERNNEYNVEKNLRKYEIIRKERYLIEYIIMGLEYKDIAEKLNIPLTTLKKRIQILYNKCGIQNKIELINFINEKL